MRGSGLFHDEFHSHIQIGSIKSAESRTPLIIMRTYHFEDKAQPCSTKQFHSCAEYLEMLFIKFQKAKAKCPHLFWGMMATNGPSPISHLHLGYLGTVTITKHWTQSFEKSSNLIHCNNLKLIMLS